MIEPVKLSEWARANGVSRQSATRWFHAGVLAVPARQLATGTILVEEAVAPAAGVAIYARVSSGDQRGNLNAARNLAGLAEAVANSAGTGSGPETGRGDAPANGRGEERFMGSPRCSSENRQDGTSASAPDRTVTAIRQRVAPKPVLIGSDR